MKVIRGRFSGRVNNEVYVSTKYGQVVRSRPRRKPSATPERTRAWVNLGSVTRSWRDLTNQQYAAWVVAARRERMNPYQFFCKINGTLAAYGHPQVMDPPRPERLRRNPVERLEILNRHGNAMLRLRVPEAPAAFTFVFGIRWCSRGIHTPRRNGVLLGRLPGIVRGWSDITDLYVKRFGVPQPGTRIFIWTRQVANGRKDALKLTWADVP